MKSFISLDENIKEKPNVIDFLDSLDTDAKIDLEKEINHDEITENEDQEVHKEDIQEESNEQNETLTNFLDKEECTALTVTKPNSLFVAEKMFKKSIKISIKSFLISLSLGFLNLFI